MRIVSFNFLFAKRENIRRVYQLAKHHAFKNYLKCYISIKTLLLYDFASHYIYHKQKTSVNIKSMKNVTGNFLTANADLPKICTLGFIFAHLHEYTSCLQYI